MRQPLQGARRQTQAEMDADERLWQSIVDGLRSQGWSRWDAYQEADDKLARLHKTEQT
ncbi:MAG: hypothetical protein AAF125_05665 [Chloroflexota bacterium]